VFVFACDGTTHGSEKYIRYSVTHNHNYAKARDLFGQSSYLDESNPAQSELLLTWVNAATAGNGFFLSLGHLAHVSHATVSGTPLVLNLFAKRL
jgi:hypothetical protein